MRGILWKNEGVPGSDLPHFKAGDVISGCSIKKIIWSFILLPDFFLTPGHSGRWSRTQVIFYFITLVMVKKADYPQ